MGSNNFTEEQLLSVCPCSYSGRQPGSVIRKCVWGRDILSSLKLQSLLSREEGKKVDGRKNWLGRREGSWINMDVNYMRLSEDPPVDLAHLSWADRSLLSGSVLSAREMAGPSNIFPA